MNISATTRVYKALVLKGEQLTARQIAARYKLANPYDAIYTLRKEGYPIYLNERKNSKGEVTNKYRFGTPTRKMSQSFAVGLD